MDRKEKCEQGLVSFPTCPGSDNVRAITTECCSVALDRSRYAGLWDITVSGGIPTECNIREGLEKEAEEEAGMDKELLKNAK